MPVDIRAVLPHRYPFLMVDAFVSQDGDEFECVKHVSHNEPYFVGHFPGEPVMPGVMIIEALAQAAGVGLAVREGAAGNGEAPVATKAATSSASGPAVGYLAAIDEARFKRKVVPGDTLRLTGTILMFRRGLCKVAARAMVGDEVAVEATLSFIYGR
ncbi:MAG TPA: 3-hydroxyacyl-ACP dehydratase FabZ [Trueperaceae bacterium]|nr:3-hydroxyacyl-ACP dehydratase FabZ [Trueperaceae bacterium]